MIVGRQWDVEEGGRRGGGEEGGGGQARGGVPSVVIVRGSIKVVSHYLEKVTKP